MINSSSSYAKTETDRTLGVIDDMGQLADKKFDPREKFLSCLVVKEIV
jgi:hypothetical protein